VELLRPKRNAIQGLSAKKGDFQQPI